MSCREIPTVTPNRCALLLALWGTCHLSAQAADLSPSWELVEERKFFLHGPPGSFTGLYRTQGMATDGHRWFFSWQYGIEIANADFVSVKRNSSFRPPDSISPGIPPGLAAQGLDHIGDIDYLNGIIYASLDTTNGYSSGHVALY